MIDPQEKQKQLKEFESSLEGKTLEELQALEQEVVTEAEKTDKEISEKYFELPTENYEFVAKAIHTILDKKTVQWQFTLGMVSMYDFWDETQNPGKVAYPMLDGTLRALGEASFTGYSEWAAVVAINKYFESLREEYINITERVYDIASKHNVLIDKIQKMTPIGDLQSNEVKQ